MRNLKTIALAIAGNLLVSLSMHAATPDGRGFPTADAAASALISATKTGNIKGLIAILGPSAKDIVVTSDPVADRKARTQFVARAAERIKLVADPKTPNEKTLLIGKDMWPLPIPLVQVAGKWYFDVEQGKDEILTRRIGSNELDAIEVCRGFVEAQNDYAEEPRVSGVRQYAQRIISSPGKRDGLYWPGTGEQNASPMGGLVAKAFAQGYTSKHDPYHGYYFKVLTGQGPNATGGQMSYIDNGAMTKGFALIAWPSDYGTTGVMTLLVDKTGIVYEKNLGEDTAAIAGAYTDYDPNETWTPVTNSLGQVQAKR